jgi:EmrB/QacA subfamily drug resistance transporter
VLATVMVGTVMGPLDASVVNIALPSLTQYFRVPITTVEWVVLAYLLALSTLLLTFGRLGDMFGHKRLYVAGFVVFTLGSLACALSWSIWALIGFRVVQALGAGMLFAVGPAIITETFPGYERGRALGFVGIAVSTGLAIGPSLGGFIIAVANWRWLFLINIPIGIAASFMALRFLRSDVHRRGQRFDPLGALFSFTALFPLLLVLSKGEAWGWTSPQVVVLTIVFLASAVAFFVTELRVPQPVLDLRLFTIRIFSASVASALASYVVIASVLFLMPFYLLRVRGFPVEQAGLMLTPVPLVTAVVGPIAGSLSDRIGSRLLSTAGLLVSTVGVSSLAGLGLHTSVPAIAGRLALLGLGMGLFQSPNSSAIMGSVPRTQLGIASGMVATARNVGMVLGVSLAGFILSVREPIYLAAALPHLPLGLATKEAFLHAMHDAVLAAGAICFLGAMASLVRGAPPPRREVVPGSEGRPSEA